MPTAVKTKAAAAPSIVLRITSPTPLPAAELRRRAQAVLAAAGLEAAPPPVAKKPMPRRTAKPKLTPAEAYAESEGLVEKMELRAADTPPITEEEIVAEVRLVRQERYERAQVQMK